MAGTPGSAARMRPAGRPGLWGGDERRPGEGREPWPMALEPRDRSLGPATRLRVLPRADGEPKPWAVRAGVTD